MSTAIAKNFQVGSDSTATNNFTIRQPATPDGTVRIANGNSGTTTDLVTVTSAGNVGVGVTPSAWNSAVRAIELLSPGSAIYGLSGGTTVTAGAYIDSVGWKYSVSGVPITRYDQGAFASGQHTWFNAASGTAGNAISWTQAMTLTAGGDLGVGTSSPGAKLEVNGSLRASSALSTAGMFIVASGSFNNSSANNIGTFSESHIIIHIATGGNKLSSIPVYPNGGAGIAYVYNYMNPATAAWTNTGGSDLNFTFSCAGSSANTYNVIMTAGGGVLTVQRTAGSAAYAVYVQRIASL